MTIKTEQLLERVESLLGKVNLDLSQIITLYLEQRAKPGPVARVPLEDAEREIVFSDSELVRELNEIALPDALCLDESEVEHQISSHADGLPDRYREACEVLRRVQDFAQRKLWREPTEQAENARLPPNGPFLLPVPFRNDAGLIQNLYEGEHGPAQTVSIIRTRAGKTRSRHWHRTDWHLLYVLEGEMRYYEREVGSTLNPDPVTYGPGQACWTGPGVEHVTHFPVETVLISIARNKRDALHHEQDVVRVPFGIETD